MGRMEADHLPKQILFGELLSARLFYGPKLRWRDVVLRDLWIIGFDATSWYSTVQDHGGWYDTCQTFASRSVPTASGPIVITGLAFVCECGRMFRRWGDLTRHQNFCDRQPPVTGSFVCECGQMFRRHGDLTQHQNFCDTHSL